MQPPDDAARVARGAAANLVAMLARLLRPLFLFVAATLYGPASFGQYILAWTLVDVCGKAATFGLDKGLLRLVPRAERPADGERVLRAALHGTFLGGGALTLLLAAAAPLVARFYRMPDLRWVTILLAPAVVTTALVTTLTSALMAVGIMRGQVVRALAEPAALILFALTLRGALGRAPWVLALAHGLSQLVVVAAALWVYARVFSIRRTLFDLARAKGQRGLGRFALPMWASDGLAVAMSRGDLLALGRLFDNPALIGMYALAKQIANVVNVVRFSFDPVFWPRVAALEQAGDHAGLEKTYRLVARWVAMLALPLALVLGRFGGELARLVGRDYRGPALVFALLVFGQTWNAIGGLAGHLIAMAGRPLEVVRGYAAGAALAIAGTVLLAGPLGTIGAALASAAAYAGVMSYQIVRAWRLHRVSPLSRGLGKVALAAAVMTAVLVWAARVLHPVPATLLGLAAYAAVLALAGAEPEDAAVLEGVRGPAKPA